MCFVYSLKTTFSPRQNSAVDARGRRVCSADLIDFSLFSFFFPHAESHSGESSKFTCTKVAVCYCAFI